MFKNLIYNKLLLVIIDLFYILVLIGLNVKMSKTDTLKLCKISNINFVYGVFSI